MDLKKYRDNLVQQELPVFYDTYHVKKTFRISGSINFFIDNNVSYYKIEKHRKILVTLKDGEEIKKKHYRKIYTASSKLAYIQKWILDNILSKLSPSEYAHGFVKNKSLLSNAKEHLREEESWLFRVDISNFFDSISYESVEKMFQSFGYSKSASNILASLCCHNGFLRQGFCTSPTLANLYLKEFDTTISNKIKAYSDLKVRYSRYADDLFFSGIKTGNDMQVINKIKQISGFYLKKYSLRINRSKLSIQDKKRKRITGLYIEGTKVSVSKTYIKKLEREIYFCEKYGITTHLNHIGKLDKMNFYKYMMGRCAFVKMVEPESGKYLIERLRRLFEDYL